MIIIGDNNTTKIIDKEIIEKYKYNTEVLVENVANRLLENIDLKYNNYVILVGPGNNGADGYALAKLLSIKNKNVVIFKLFDKIYSKTCQFFYDITKSLNIPIISNINDLNFYLEKADIVIDAIFGTGLNNDLDDITKKVIYLINKYKKSKNYLVYSVDIPTGFHSKTGDIINMSVHPDYTLSISTYKEGFLNYENEKYLGKIIILKEIGVPYSYLLNLSKNYLIEKEDVLSFIKPRKNYSNKNNYGKSFLLVGSDQYVGAALLALKACVKLGSGYTYLVSSHENLQNCVWSIPEIIFTQNFEDLDKATSIAIGSGTIYNDKLKEIIEKYKENKKMVIDAGAINNKINYNNAKNCILTPHSGEFSKLIDISYNEIDKNPIKYITEFCLKNDTNVLLKGKNTYISNGEKTYVVNTGNPYMANAGMGDVLTGMITSFASQGLDIIESAITGAYLHGYCADILLENQYVINPSDIVENCNLIYKNLKKG